MPRPLPLAQEQGLADSRTQSASGARPVILQGGFRPFFLLTGAYASVSIVAWVLAYSGVWQLPPQWVPMWWHGHELIFGFAGAAICGFLLTAVPRWTRTAPVSGMPLLALALIWVAGRAAMWSAGFLPGWLVAVIDLALFPALAVAVAKPIVRSRNRRNYGFPLLLATLFVANLLTHLQVLGVARTGRTGLYLGLYVVVVMVTLIAGRIVPTFTRNALAARGEGETVRRDPWLSRGALAMVVAAALFQVFGGTPRVAGTSAALAAVLLGVEAVGWQPLRTLRNPIVWVLHVGHGWLVVGFAALAVAELAGGLPVSTATHALTAGAIGTMVIAVMSRASLGHTGRPLRAPAPVVAAYLLVIVGAAVRVFGPAVRFDLYRWWVIAGGTLWALGYALFTAVYAPILLRPRRDASEGA